MKVKQEVLKFLKSFDKNSYHRKSNKWTNVLDEVVCIHFSLMSLEKAWIGVGHGVKNYTLATKTTVKSSVWLWPYIP